MPLQNTFAKTQKVHLETFGCTANVGDTMKLRAILRKDGHAIVAEGEADVVIVNTCTVAKRTELNVLKRLKELKEEGKEVVVAGCMAAAQPDLVKSILGNEVTMVTPQDIYKGYIEDQWLDFDGVISVIPIAMGCVGKCSYCIVKRARGDLRSYKPEKICEAVKSAVERGAKEIRITSQDCSAYGWEDVRALKLPELLEMITPVEGNFRIRVGMMNPFTMIHILDELLDAFDSKKIFKFFHVPVQSGSDKVLRDMNRNYKAVDFVEIVKSIRQRFEDSTICTDFIVGFPTETEKDFFSSLSLLDDLKPEKVNITRFSPRPGTEASKLKDLLEREKKKRSRIFSSLYQNIVREKNNELEGKKLPVLITEKGKKGGVIGRDPAYRLVVLNKDLPLGATYTVRVTEAKSTYLMAEIQNVVFE
ncbi:MAG TPA: tRNA (N(6)-L-threonylcarbamoyladenosine(37)-C(2))-methylthiotransferase [Candidatus Bathyarchaeia archaeon]|nr:tRNA (N(6)-L-threonylcarbamoyladenosine(37)-C(2))-methylthiotransferase [Candidatus Bathyarchaeia archaeon]